MVINKKRLNIQSATAKELQFGDALSQVKDSILTAMEDGKLKKVPILSLMLVSTNPFSIKSCWAVFIICCSKSLCSVVAIILVVYVVNKK